MRREPLHCTDCTPRKVDATHVPPNYHNKKPVREGGWDGTAYCAEHAKNHPGAIPDPLTAHNAPEN